MFFRLKKFLNFTFFPKVYSVIIRQLFIARGDKIVGNNGNTVDFIAQPKLVFWNVFARSWNHRYQIFFIIQTKQLRWFILVLRNIFKIGVWIAFLNYIIFWKFAKSIWESMLFELRPRAKFWTFFLFIFFETI